MPAYYVTLPFLYLISLLPDPLLYGLSDLLYFILYRCVGYRKKVVMTNLRNAFPEKTEAERQILAGKFYHHLCDLFVESIGMLTVRPSRALKRCHINPDTMHVFDHYFGEKKQNVILVMGHWGNWEWAIYTFCLQCDPKLYVIYHPLSNAFFDKLVAKVRTRYGARLIPMKNTFRSMITHKDELQATAFVADQTPSSPEQAYWTTFLNQDTPVFRGTAVMAKRLNYPVVYGSIRKVKRGRYVISLETLVDDPASLPEDAISELHTRRLEKDIREIPEAWLWSHRRWKHRRAH